ncbi:hypothetical protein FHR83_002103 [Actinoplanes campanulatus]|uniref:Uncharacterized protein n=1 Tax=Actinoplanes campanulatus TaxID=113559 RepID=A0A7W5FDM6_9ACTN|nr:hypothetical protein [Actinoplanes campanulatus]MBB3094451.1 hypothetical protein [Actinoplanes campanulatus]GGN21134.1 hypothetical protein GCM10010109_35150 [Actinoplanes campanulatus]GID35635.1 hypothetical protein Aca09nite_21410 [Actinoplanes campanulatus]
MSLDSVRAVADTVLYEGYLLYPYRAGAAKNRSRWQFGVLGPPHAVPAAFAEPPEMSMQCLLTPDGAGWITVRLRFLQLQSREVQRRRGDDHEPAERLRVGGTTLLSWDEAVEREITLPDLPVHGDAEFPVSVPGGEDVEPVHDGDGRPVGRVVRRRWPLTARVRTSAQADDGLLRLTVSVTNEHAERVPERESATRHSLIAAHLMVEAHDAEFVSVREPIPAARRCRQDRCWPVLAGPPGETRLLLGAPIILYDHPRLAERSPGDLFDGCEIDELLTMRVRTMTDHEKAEARATDPRAAAIVDRCDALDDDALLSLHGTRIDAEANTHGTRIDARTITHGTLVRLRPARRADAQDLFLAGRIALVNEVITDVDGGTHVAVVLLDDPAADLHDGYGRYLYFAPDELEPVS